MNPVCQQDLSFLILDSVSFPFLFFPGPNIPPTLFSFAPKNVVAEHENVLNLDFSSSRNHSSDCADCSGSRRKAEVTLRRD